MLDEGVKSSSDGIHWIHWRRTDSDGKVHVPKLARIKFALLRIARSIATKLYFSIQNIGAKTAEEKKSHSHFMIVHPILSGG